MKYVEDGRGRIWKQNHFRSSERILSGLPQSRRLAVNVTDCFKIGAKNTQDLALKAIPIRETINLYRGI